MILKHYVTILLQTTKVFIVTILCNKWRLSFKTETAATPEDGADSIETCQGNNTVTIYGKLTCILLENTDVLQRHARCGQFRSTHYEANLGQTTKRKILFVT